MVPSAKWDPPSSLSAEAPGPGGPGGRSPNASRDLDYSHPQRMGLLRDRRNRSGLRPVTCLTSALCANMTSLEAALISRRRPHAPGPHRVPAGSRVSSHSTGQRQREPRPGGKSPASSRPRAHCAFGGWGPIQGTADASGHAREAVGAGQSLTTWGQDSAPRLHTAQGCASAAASLGSGGGLSPTPHSNRRPGPGVPSLPSLTRVIEPLLE